jgi:pSer/pThr/pTyr-binding forkhead associated (FHA) protein
MITKLVVASGKSAGRSISIKRNKLLIGRSEECDVRPLSEDVSRRHCAVHVGPVEVWVEDLGSRNGTFVNGTKIAGKTRVSDGDIIRVGALELKVSCSDPAAKAGTEDDVSRWLMADEKPAGMFDTTQPLPGAKAASSGEGSGNLRVAGSSPAADDSSSGSFVSGIHSVPAAAGGSHATASVSAIEALKTANAKPGGMPQAAKKGADSSRDAAAEALKKFFEKR